MIASQRNIKSTNHAGSAIKSSISRLYSQEPVIYRETARMKMLFRSSLKSRIFIGNSILLRCYSQMKIGASSMMQHTAGSAVMAISGLAKG